MLSRSALIELLGEGDWVTVTDTGEPITMEIAPNFGPATLLVRPVTDALKTVNTMNRVESSVDRSDIWSVVGFALNRVVIRRLEEGEMSGRQLLEAVTRMGLAWQWSRVPDKA